MSHLRARLAWPSLAKARSARNEQLRAAFLARAPVQAALPELQRAVQDGTLSPTVAALRLLKTPPPQIN